ncbi:helix-turn-helix domain-containing protein [Nostoc sp. XA010]|nr:helix-turn-helix domain-containing protein [Nostoc sp. XA010]
MDIFKAKIYPTNEQRTCISQILGCKFINMLR